MNIFLFSILAIILLFLSIKYINNTKNIEMNLSKKVQWYELVILFFIIIIFFLTQVAINSSINFQNKGYILFLFLLFISFIDLKRKYIPDIFSILLIIFGVSYSIISNHLEIDLKNSLFLAFPSLILYFYGDKLFKTECIGAGDIKLILGLGFFFTDITVYDVYIYYALAYLIAFPIAIYLLFNPKSKKFIPFAPFLSISAIYLYHLKGGFLYEN